MIIKIGKFYWKWKLDWSAEIKKEADRLLELFRRIKNVVRVIDVIIRHISRVTALVTILLLLIIIYGQDQLKNLDMQGQELQRKWGQDLDVKLKMDKVIMVQDEKIKAQVEDIEKMKAEALESEKKHYYQKLSERILGLYSAWGMKRTDKDAKIIQETVVRVFETVQILYDKGLMKNIIKKFPEAKNPRITSLICLAIYKRETNFDLDCIQWNYVRERPSYHVLLFSKEDKERIEGIGKLWDDNCKMLNDGRVELKFDGGRKEYVKPIGKINKIIPTEFDQAFIVFNGKKQNVTAVNYAIKTTRDWGGLQVNDINLPWGFDALYKSGLWNQTMGKWAMDYVVNIELKMVELDDEMKNGRIDLNNPPWDVTLYNTLFRVTGWENIYK